MVELKGYITNLGKYNEGELIGEWITFPIDEDELNEVKERIGCYYEDEDGEPHNEEYEEYFFTDWDCEIDLGLGEYPDIDEVNEMAECMEGWTDYQEKLFKAVCECWNVDPTSFDEDEYCLYEDINTDEDLGYYWVHESGCYDLEQMGTLANYIDYESFGRDIRLESNGYHSEYGWVERR